MRVRNAGMVVLVGGALVVAAASFVADPEYSAGVACCTCLQLTSPTGQKLEAANPSNDCIPGETSEATNSCATSVGEQMSDKRSFITTVNAACYEEYCKECGDAQKAGLAFAVSGGDGGMGDGGAGDGG